MQGISAVPTTLTIMVYMNNRLNIEEIFDKLEIGESTDEIEITHIRLKITEKSWNETSKSFISTETEMLKGDRRTKSKKIDRSGKGIKSFSNQTTIEIKLDGERNINLMCFATSIKIVGCREIEDSIRLVKWFAKLTESDEYSFIIESVMQNMKLDLKLGEINREKLNRMINDKVIDDDLEVYSQFEPALHPNVMIIFSFKNYLRNYIKISGDEVEIVHSNPYKKKKDLEIIETKLKVYESSQVVITGRDLETDQRCVEILLKFVRENFILEC
jgi:hypothetical protein